MKQQTIRLVPYTRHGEPPRRAAIVPVDFDDSGLSDTEKELLSHLGAAADCMHPVSVYQKCVDAPGLSVFLEGIISRAEGNLKEDLIHYRAVLFLQNKPWASQPRKNHVLSVSPEDRIRLKELAAEAGLAKEFDQYSSYLFEDLTPNPRSGFYPPDLSEDELAELGLEGLTVNSLVRRDGEGKPYVMVNECFFRGACRAAAAHLRKARELVADPHFRMYLDAKIEELTTGSEEARRLADYHWIRHDHPIDFILSTAIEVYDDEWKNIRGAAAAAVTVRNPGYDRFLEQLLELVPRFEAEAPWEWRREDIDPETLPKLKFVDVFSWTGDYLGSPGTVMAQSLPNDEWVGKNIGTVNLVYRNVCDAIFDISKGFVADEFFSPETNRKYRDILPWADHVHSILHEIGHATGRQDPDHPGRASHYLESEFSALEETRAELFGMWAAGRAAEAGIIDTEVEEAAHYAMLLSMVFSLSFEPEQAHIKARNLIFHRIEEDGAVRRSKEDGKTLFTLDFETLRPAVSALLAETGNLKAAGDKAGTEKLRERYCYTDSMKDEVDRRLGNQPRGRGLIFPEYRRGITEGLEHPEFEEQGKFHLWFP